MQPVLNLLRRVGPSTAHVLITGEHGTGKEVMARWLHELSPRADRPLVTVNAGGLAEGVFESELFGHVKGAFTDARSDRIGYFEMADGGTLFLDEIGNLKPAQQAKLLRVLQTGELTRVGSSRAKQVDVRVLAATNIDIRREVTEGRFREDLLYRLNTVEIHLPPLRERAEDIPRLATSFSPAPPRATASGSRASRRRRSRSWRRTRGRGTCGSWSTPSSARCSSLRTTPASGRRISCSGPRRNRPGGSRT
jgi:transcriptional regulator with GAF, ATPase, and Fis domain